jgi:F-type H+-transporting ATPase subunit delta
MAKTKGKIAKRYARALFELSQPQELEVRRDALLALAQEFKASTQLQATLKNPAISPDQRTTLVREVVSLFRPNDEILSNLIVLLLTNDRLSALDEVAKTFSQLIEHFMRAVALEVTTALPLSADEQRTLQEQVRAKVPTKYAEFVSISWKNEPSLLGGMIIKAGDKVLDGSLSGSLDRIARSLTA